MQVTDFLKQCKSRNLYFVANVRSTWQYSPCMVSLFWPHSPHELAPRCQMLQGSSMAFDATDALHRPA